MIYCKEVTSGHNRKAFYEVPARLYAGTPNWRNTEEEIVHMLVEKKSCFFLHASIHSFLLMDQGQVVGRFSLIHDEKLPEYVQIAFFEATFGLTGVQEAVFDRARIMYPSCTKVVAGLCGHLNYAAGFLDSAFDEPPLFGLPYTPPWYPDYFPSLTKKPLVSYRFSNQLFYDLLESGHLDVPLGSITIRKMSRRHLKRDVAIYTELNNTCFSDHPYWSDRTAEEDLELFLPFRFLLKEENLLIAEDQGRPVGFLLWYPDFNELVSGSSALGIREVLHYHVANPIRSSRLTEIAVIPEYRRKGIVQAMIKEMTGHMQRGGFEYTEGGFIFEENQASIGFTLMMLRKAFGVDLQPHRKYTVLDGEL
ncbi:GNAT family N-acetyltransferase [Myxococcota bacterium]|nr:GNAT family N-acetyltransferase [Myxococcota bacterium]MBU1536931.1 GNAT family N-acetyltransferase [Myxococcota bacterium]